MTTTVNMVTETSWILGRCARELQAALDWTINSPSASSVDYHLPYWRGLGKRKPELRVGYFTHGRARAAKACREFDACVTMNEAMRQYLLDHGARSVTIIRPGVDVSSPEPLFGVAGRTYRDGRKGERLVTEMVRAGYRVWSLGAGWPCEQWRPSASVEFARDRAAFYGAIDYLVVTSLDEGGPMPALEAVAARTPVIAPDVGWCWELPVIRYERGSWPSLSSVLTRLTTRDTWKDWVDAHARLFAQITERAA